MRYEQAFDRRKEMLLFSLSRLRGRVGVGVPNKNDDAERCPHPPRSASVIAGASLQRSCIRTAAKGGLRSPASGRGKKTDNPTSILQKLTRPVERAKRKAGLREGFGG